MKKKIVLILSILLFIFFFSACQTEKAYFNGDIVFALSFQKDGGISQTITFPTQEKEMGLSEEQKEKYISELLTEIKTTLFFSYFYNFWTISENSNNDDFKIGGEKMNYILPTYNEKQGNISFSFYFANSKVWDFYHPKTEKEDNYQVQKGFFIDKGTSSGNVLFTEKITIKNKEQTLGNYFYTILSTIQSKYTDQTIEKPVFVYEYNHYSNKLHTNADYKSTKDNLYSNAWVITFEELETQKTIEIFVYSPNREIWYLVALIGVILTTICVGFILYIKERKRREKEKI